MLNEIHTEVMEGIETEMMPVLFLGHGSPMNAIEENEFVVGFKNVEKTIPKPRAIVCVSAHWETNGTYVTAMEKPPTIHDFGGFPDALYAVEYPAPGNPLLAEEIALCVTKAKIGLDYAWGLDHGTWSVLTHMYPNADVPVIQMSLDFSRGPQHHYDIARELQSLRKKGVLIVGSGNIVHNLSRVAWGALHESFGHDWAINAHEKMKEFIMNDNHQALINYTAHGETFDMAIPSPEHYLPLLYILALKEKHEQVTIFNDTIVGGAIAMTSLKIS
jgi:4,5-DOPA dioxygenase extradiol